jgi:hypothetical protein
VQVLSYLHYGTLRCDPKPPSAEYMWGGALLHGKCYLWVSFWLVAVTIRLCSAQKLSLDFTSPPEKAIVFDFLSQKEEHFS